MKNLVLIIFAFPSWIFAQDTSNFFLSISNYNDTNFIPSDRTVEVIIGQAYLKQSSKIITPKIYSLKNVESITFINVNLNSIPKEILTFKHLKSIFITKSSICQIPPFLSKFDSLETLFILKSKIKRIPIDLALYPQLKRLGLSGNKGLKLDLLPPILNATQISSLVIGAPNTKNLPTSFSSLHIKFLRIDHSKVLDILNIIKITNNINSLQELSFFNCKLTYEDLQYLSEKVIRYKVSIVNCRLPNIIYNAEVRKRLGANMYIDATDDKKNDTY